MDDEVSKPKPTFKKIVEGCAVAVILSMVIGNMFVARRYKSYMKAKIPSWEEATKSTSPGYNKTKTEYEYNSTNNATKNQQNYSSSSSSSSSKYSNENSTANESTHFKRRTHNKSSSETSGARSSSKVNIAMSTTLIRSLAVLGLPYYPVPTNRAVKDAYYRLARKYHPDLFPTDHPERKAYEQKFKNISVAYKECLEKLPADHYESEARL